MAENLEDGEFWLPSEFLTDDCFLQDEDGGVLKENSKLWIPGGFDSCEPSPSSPVESLAWSTETESDEEDFLAALRSQMTGSLVIEDERLASTEFRDGNPNRVMAGSPQSTLSVAASWSSFSNVSSQTSSKGPSQASSPSSTPMKHNRDSWELLYAAAGQVGKMKMKDRSLEPRFHDGLGPPNIQVPARLPSFGQYDDEALKYLQMQYNLFQILKKQQLIKRHCSTAWGKQPRFSVGGRTAGFEGPVRGKFRSAELSSPWPVAPSSQQKIPAGSGMRAVFLGGSGSQRGSSGTGVFLPRRDNYPAEHRRKPSCSTVLVPDRVVQALNLNLDKMGSPHSPFQDSTMASSRNTPPPFYPQRGAQTFHPSSASASAASHEFPLPREWTY